MDAIIPILKNGMGEKREKRGKKNVTKEKPKGELEQTKVN